MPKWAELGVVADKMESAKAGCSSVFRVMTENTIDIVCPVCAEPASLVRWGVTSVSMSTLTMVFHCNDDECDTEFPVDIHNVVFPGSNDAVLEHRPEKISPKAKKVHGRLGIDS